MREPTSREDPRTGDGSTRSPGLTARGHEIYREVAAALGADSDEIEDEHPRWAVYEDALRRAHLRDLLLQIVAEDGALAEPLVVRALADVGHAEGRLWVDRLPTDRRVFAERRLREWSLIREVTVEPRPVVADPAELSAWCQWTLVERSTSEVVLDDLAEHGASRKTRNAAREKRRKLAR